jgi:hypothetical protein
LSRRTGAGAGEVEKHAGPAQYLHGDCALRYCNAVSLECYWVYLATLKIFLALQTN